MACACRRGRTHWPAWWTTPSPESPPVTVLLSAYNGARYLPALLDSLAAQTAPWRLLWRDDGSTDDTPAMLRAVPGAREASAAGRLGVLRSFLSLLREASADSQGPVAFCDQDDVWLPDKLARGVAAVSGDSPVLYCARQTLVDAALRPIGISPRVRHAGFPAALTQNIAAGCTIVMNAAAARLVAASEPPAGTLHDWWSYLLVAAAGGRIVTDPQPTILYRQHQANVVGAPASLVARGLAAARRGPGVFMAGLHAHVAALRRHDAMLTPDTRAALTRIARALEGPRIKRVSLLRMPGLRRQTALETLVLFVWLILQT